VRDLKDVSPTSCESADAAFRKAFGQIVAAYRSVSQKTYDQLHDATRPRLAQGNPGAARDLEAASGWINPDVAAELFAELEIPGAVKLGEAYRTLKSFVDGHSEGYYRSRR
jgi:hypothetical protein